MRAGGVARQRLGLPAARGLARLDGRLRDYALLSKEDSASRSAHAADEKLLEISLDMAIKGPSATGLARLDTAIANVPFRELPMIDRPYLSSAVALARAGNGAKARAMLARYQSEMTDTSIRRQQAAALRSTLAEIALAEGKPLDAVDEFRRGDVGYDGAPADECGACLFFNLARAFDAAGRPDSAVLYFEKYLATPYWQKADVNADPIRLPAIRERLGQLYESLGNTQKAADEYRAFIELWKNADAELQPRVADARQRLTRLTAVEKPRP
jgi:tetratricopeptide (TPR) repeat protein